MGVTEIFSSIYGLKMKLGPVILLKGRLFQGYMIFFVIKYFRFWFIFYVKVAAPLKNFNFLFPNNAL